MRPRQTRNRVLAAMIVIAALLMLGLIGLPASQDGCGGDELSTVEEAVRAAGGACGDGVCSCTESANGSCAGDCAQTSGPAAKQFTCGNGTCESAETAASCPADCGTCGSSTPPPSPSGELSETCDPSAWVDTDGDGAADACPCSLAGLRRPGACLAGFPILCKDSSGAVGVGACGASCMGLGPGGCVAPTDPDGDGFFGAADRFPNDGSEATDLDGDGIGDVADPDDDGDGLPDSSDPDPTAPAVVVDLAVPRHAVAGTTYSFTVRLVGSVSTPVTLTMPTKPSSATLDPATGQVSWTPTSLEKGAQTFVAVASVSGATVTSRATSVVGVPLDGASATIDSAGGYVEITNRRSPAKGARIDIPGGALAAPTTISIRPLDTGGAWATAVASGTEEVLGEPLLLEPEGLTFAVPADLRFPKTVSGTYHPMLVRGVYTHPKPEGNGIDSSTYVDSSGQFHVRVSSFSDRAIGVLKSALLANPIEPYLVVGAVGYRQLRVRTDQLLSGLGRHTLYERDLEAQRRAVEKCIKPLSCGVVPIQDAITVYPDGTKAVAGTRSAMYEAKSSSGVPLPSTCARFAKLAACLWDQMAKVSRELDVPFAPEAYLANLYDLAGDAEIDGHFSVQREGSVGRDEYSDYVGSLKGADAPRANRPEWLLTHNDGCPASYNCGYKEFTPISCSGGNTCPTSLGVPAKEMNPPCCQNGVVTTYIRTNADGSLMYQGEDRSGRRGHLVGNMLAPAMAEVLTMQQRKDYSEPSENDYKVNGIGQAFGRAILRRDLRTSAGIEAFLMRESCSNPGEPAPLTDCNCRTDGLCGTCPANTGADSNRSCCPGPEPHWKSMNGACVPSCGVLLGQKNLTGDAGSCRATPCAPEQDLGKSHDCPYCCAPQSCDAAPARVDECPAGTIGTIVQRSNLCNPGSWRYALSSNCTNCGVTIAPNRHGCPYPDTTWDCPTGWCVGCMRPLRCDCSANCIVCGSNDQCNACGSDCQR
ncbi:MAG: hypothetical protein HY791_16790 [Deltaproteobacteria bacterium]|nr:hypothetical protein [Deltaproteobacteria bacterium]